MHNRNKSIYSVIDATPGQHDYPLTLWGLASVELWTKNEKEDNKYKKIELYHFVNYFQVDAFKINFFKEFEIYKKEYPDGTIETFRKKEYQQFIYECGDMIEMLDKEDYYYWTTVRGLDFYLQQIDFYKKAYVLTKDPHSHEINLRALLQFLEVDYINDYQDKLKNIKGEEIKEKWHALLYWFELNSNGKQLPINSEGQFIKSELMKEGEKRTGKSGQVFYTTFKDLDINDSKKLDRTFGKEWKEKIINLSNNDSIIIDYINKKYNS